MPDNKYFLFTISTYLVLGPLTGFYTKRIKEIVYSLLYYLYTRQSKNEDNWKY